MARFVSDRVEALEADELYAPCEKEDRGYPPYDPGMMAKVLPHAHGVGVPSSGRIGRNLQEDVSLRCLAAGNQPGFPTIADFRKRHLEALSRLFVQIPKLCLIKLYRRLEGRGSME